MNALQLLISWKINHWAHSRLSADHTKLLVETSDGWSIYDILKLQVFATLPIYCFSIWIHTGDTFTSIQPIGTYLVTWTWWPYRSMQTIGTYPVIWPWWPFRSIRKLGTYLVTWHWWPFRSIQTIETYLVTWPLWPFRLIQTIGTYLVTGLWGLFCIPLLFGLPMWEM